MNQEEQDQVAAEFVASMTIIEAIIEAMTARCVRLEEENAELRNDRVLTLWIAYVALLGVGLLLIVLLFVFAAGIGESISGAWS